MPKRTDIDYVKLLAMVKAGVPQAEIMLEMGIKTIPQLKTAILNAYMSEGTIPKLVGGRRGKGKGKAGNIVRVNKRGSLVVTKELVSAFGFKEGEEFTVTQVGFGIEIRKMGAGQE